MRIPGDGRWADVTAFEVSPQRPNPIGLHRTEITAIDGRRLQVGAVEVLDGTPIIDVKPVLSGAIDQR